MVIKPKLAFFLGAIIYPPASRELINHRHAFCPGCPQRSHLQTKLQGLWAAIQLQGETWASGIHSRLCSKTVWSETQPLKTAAESVHRLLAVRSILGLFFPVSGCSLLCSALKVPKPLPLQQEDERQGSQGLFLLQPPAGKAILACLCQEPFEPLCIGKHLGLLY